MKFVDVDGHWILGLKLDDGTIWEIPSKSNMMYNMPMHTCKEFMHQTAWTSIKSQEARRTSYGTYICSHCNTLLPTIAVLGWQFSET
jgi:hypothetical protein